MKKLFVQFYFLFFVCFLVMIMLVGLVYKFIVECVGWQLFDDLMKSLLYLMCSELWEILLCDWSKIFKELDLNLLFDLYIELISKFKLLESLMQYLCVGDIVVFDDQYIFIQCIFCSYYVLLVGLVFYFYFLYEMCLLDVVLMVFIVIFLVFLVFIWMCLYWQDMLCIEMVVQCFGEGYFSECIYFDSMFSFEWFGVVFN